MSGNECRRQLNTDHCAGNHGRQLVRFRLPLTKATPKPGQSLAEVVPELAAEWHPTLNGELTPYDVLPGSGIKGLVAVLEVPARVGKPSSIREREGHAIFAPRPRRWLPAAHVLRPISW